MDFLKAEILRKKKQLEESAVLQPDKKYFKRGDLAAKQEEEYWNRHKRLKTEDERAGSSSAGPSAETEKQPQQLPPRKEVVRKLRERAQPIRLFGETDAQAYQRLRKLEMSQPEITRGFKNDFQAAMDQVDQEYLNEILKSTGNNPDEGKGTDVEVKDEGITIEEIEKMAEELGEGNHDLDQEIILRYLKLVLKLWGEELNNRPPDVKRSFRGKMESATHTQTVEYIKPLFRQLKKKTTEVGILDCLVDVVKNLIIRHYLKANDAYLEMAIGNAPWPIGVTMVGIHARTGREKIFARNVAHVLNDETQRKYIQALKRLMTKSQKFFPTDPSRSVNYEPKNS